MSIKNNTASLQSLLEVVNALPEAGEQATPVISVTASGWIIATAGAKSSTHQLAFQPAKTITPSATSQVAVSSGYYTGGDITVDAIPSQYVVPSGTLTINTNGTHDVKNYASAVVNVESGGSGETAEWSENEDAIVSGTISSYTNDRVTSIGDYAFASCFNLTSVSFPACTSIGSSAFYNCSSLTTISFPVCTIINGNAFYNCYNLTSVSFPVCKIINNYAFNNCKSLTTVSFPVCTSINDNAFRSCYNLTSVSFPVCKNIGSYAFMLCSNLTSVNFPVCKSIGSYAFASCYTLSQFYLTGSSLCNLSNSNAFKSTPYAGYSSYFSGTPYIYVPASLVESYKTATNWTYFSSYFSGI